MRTNWEVRPSSLASYTSQTAPPLHFLLPSRLYLARPPLPYLHLLTSIALLLLASLHLPYTYLFLPLSLFFSSLFSIVRGCYLISPFVNICFLRKALFLSAPLQSTTLPTNLLLFLLHASTLTISFLPALLHSCPALVNNSPPSAFLSISLHSCQSLVAWRQEERRKRDIKNTSVQFPVLYGSGCFD